MFKTMTYSKLSFEEVADEVVCEERAVSDTISVSAVLDVYKTQSFQGITLRPQQLIQLLKHGLD